MSTGGLKKFKYVGGVREKRLNPMQWGNRLLNNNDKAIDIKIVARCRVGCESFPSRDEWAVKIFLVKSHLNPVPPGHE